MATLARFEATLDAVGGEVVHAAPATFESTLVDAVSRPAVGAPLPFDDPRLVLPDSVDPARTPADVDGAGTGVTAASMGIADYGSVVLPSTPDGIEPVSLFPDRHVAVLRDRDVVDGMGAALDRLGPRLRADRGSAVIATGPSATADMGDLVLGAHGPSEVTAVVVETADGVAGDGESEGERP